MYCTSGKLPQSGINSASPLTSAVSSKVDVEVTLPTQPNDTSVSYSGGSEEVSLVRNDISPESSPDHVSSLSADTAEKCAINHDEGLWFGSRGSTGEFSILFSLMRFS